MEDDINLVGITVTKKDCYCAKCCPPPVYQAFAHAREIAKKETALFAKVVEETLNRKCTKEQENND